MHRWLGLTCGAILVVTGLTGVLLAFYVEIDGAVNPRLRTDQPQAQPSSYEAVYARLQEVPVETPGYWKIEIPHVGGPITSRYYTTAASDARTRLVTLDPTTLQLRRDAYWNDTFFTWIYDLHMNFQLGPAGKIAMGVAALLMLIMLLSGIMSWALPTSSLAAKLHFKRDASAPRRIYDIHKLSGVYGLVPLLLCVGTGAMICLPNVFHPLLDNFWPLKREPSVVSVPIAGHARISVDDAIATGLAYFPGSRVVWVRVPASPVEPYDLQIRQAGAPMTRFPRTHLWIDQYSGGVLSVSDPRYDAFGDTVLNWLVPLHDGKAFGLVGRVLVMALGLLAPVLFVTGYLRWSQKRSGIRKTAHRKLHGA